MRNKLSLFFIAVLSVIVLAACGSNDDEQGATEDKQDEEIRKRFKL